MRLSTDPNDPGYEAWCQARLGGGEIDVYLDDVLQLHCEMADDETGEVLRAKHDEGGDFYLEGDEIARETVRGVVRIEVTTPPAEA